MNRTALFAAGLLAVGTLLAAPAAVGQSTQPGDWRVFEGTWTATGSRQSLPTASGRPAGTFQLSGAILLTGASGLSRGFRGEAIGFDDGSGALVGTCVWTDERGDRVFGRLQGETVASGRRVSGTVVGGTGRYSGFTGDFAFDWQYVVEGEAGTISGRSVGLRGKVRAPGGGP